MRFLYTTGIYIADFLVRFLALFNHKLKLGVEGRSSTFDILKKTIQPNDATCWFHCASLGEYEQGLPVFKELRRCFPDHKIVLTFFSPSGYEIRKNTEIADVVVYLPMDTKRNAVKFLELVHPDLTVFVKYDIWPNFLMELKKRQGRAILISALYRQNQSYFKWYGRLMRTALSAFEHIFVQDAASKLLLENHDITNVTVAGDTRFDRVTDQLKQDNSLPFIESFKQNQLCVVIGSSWPEDEEVLIPFINQQTSNSVKYIIAPHTIKPSQISNLRSKLKVKTVLFSEKDDKDLADYKVLVVDTIGLLTKIYSYADIAYVGGAMGQTGLHNILEPAVFGIPIIIGKNHQKFPEAKRMIETSGVVSIADFDSLTIVLTPWMDSAAVRKDLGALNLDFVSKHRGAVVTITDYVFANYRHMSKRF